MSGSTRPYEDRTSSEIVWIEELPRHWATVKLKYLFTERVEKGFADEPLLAATQTLGVVPKAMYGSRTVVATKDLHLLKLVHPGDFVISLRSFEGGLEYSAHRGIISPAYTILRPGARVDDGYFALLFKAHDFVQHLSLYVTGIREGQNIDYEKLGSSVMPVPPKEEQVLIARFLHSKIRQLDALINSYRGLVGFSRSAAERRGSLLFEYRHRLINDVVTGQLDVRAAAGDHPDSAIRELVDAAALTGLDVDQAWDDQLS